MTMWEESGVARAWKSLDWGVLDALHERGWISDPKSKARSVIVFPEGKAAAEELFQKYFEAAE